MGLFRKKNKTNKLSNDNFINFENLNDSDDSFLVSAISKTPNSDYFETPNEVVEKTRGYGANSGLAYYNKYSSTNQKLASSEVIDIGAIKKPAPVIKPEPIEPVKEDDYLDEGDILLKPVDMGVEEKDQDFDSFFEDFMKKTKVEEKSTIEEKQIEPSVEPVQPVKVEERPKPKKAAVQRKKKRAIDIDIISGTGGGDII